MYSKSVLDSKQYSPILFNFSVSFINDSSDLNAWIQSSFVDREPIVYQTEFLLKKREKISIVLSDVVKSHLEDNSWAPLLIMQNGE